MKTLPNGLTVFNATPHSIRFWREDWPEPVEVEPDAAINASIAERFLHPEEELYGSPLQELCQQVSLVTTSFQGNDEGRRIAIDAYASGADIVVGSIIAAQAYPGLVVAMTPAPGYERVPPAEKRMSPGKFTVFR